MRCYRNFADSACVKCVSDGQGGKIERVVPIILQARPVRWVSLRLCTVPASSVMRMVGSH